MNDLRFILTYNQTAYTLANSPNGWEAMDVKLERSERYYGVFNEYSANIQFVGDGAEIVRTAFYTDLWIEIPTLEIQRRNRYTNTYDNVYTFELDMSTFNDTPEQVSVMGIKGGLARLIKANETTVHQFGELTSDQVKFYRGATSRQVEYYDLNRVMEMLFDKVTEGGYTAGTYGLDTTLLDAYESEIVVITGRSLREQSIGDLKMSFEMFFKIINSIKPVGLTIETIDGKETLTFVDRADLFLQSEVDTIELGESFSLKPYTPYMVRNIVAGYSTNDYEDTTAQNYEFCVEANFNLPISNITNTYDIKCPIRADVYGMYEIWDTTDGQEDEMFILCVEDDPDSSYLRPDVGRVYNENLTNITALNVLVSPKRSVIAHKPWIESMADHLEGFSLGFVSGGLQLKYLTTQIEYLISELIDEGSGYELEAPSIFKPYIFSIDGTVETDFFDNVKTTPYGYITFTYEGVDYSGFIINLSYRAYGNKYVQCDLLCLPTTDLTTLIR